MRETLLRGPRVRGIIRGIVLAAFIVAANGFAAFNWIPSSYKQFTWEAYAGVVYGGSCMSPTQCESGFCVGGICCNSICNQPGQTCETGICTIPAPAPAVSHPALLLIVVMLVAIGCFALTPLRFGKRRTDKD